MSGGRKDTLSPTVTCGQSTQSGMPFVIRTLPPEGNERCIVAALRCGKPESGFSAQDVLVLELDSDVSSALTVEARFCRGDTPLFSMKNNLPGQMRVHCCFELRYLDSSRRYPRSLPGHLKCVTSGKPTRTEEIDRVEILVWSGIGFSSLTVRDLYVSETLPDLTLHGQMLVDRFGQNRRRDWNGKIHSEQELSDYLRGEYEKAKAGACYPDKDFDRWGGWKKLRFEPRGRFYLTEKDGVSWLVDPDGFAFFSSGVCYGSRMGVFGMTDAFEDLFEELPEDADVCTTAKNVREYVKRNGAADAQSRRMVNFARANFKRVFGGAWREAWLTVTRARLKAWGFNTLSVCVNEYEDEDFLWFVHGAEIPFCYTLRDFPRTETLLYRDFPDVFSAEYAEKCADYAAQVLPFAEDPFFLGYFLTNEPEWMFQKDVSIAEAVLQSDRPSASKDRLLRVLTERYGTISALNGAWGTEFFSFAEMGQGISAEMLGRTEQGKADLAELKALLLRRFAEVPSAAVRKLAPDVLNLGMRYSSVAGGSFGGTEGFDVFSFNCYRRDPGPVFDLAEKTLQTPFLVGEWHIGGEESGLLSGGIINASTQAERGKGCAEYVRTALVHPRCVGVHYFEWNDHPLLGRFDGENKQIGLIDVCNRPYADCVERFAAMNRRMYRVHSGEESPEKTDWEYRPRF